MIKDPEQPKNSFRVTVNLTISRRIDGVILEALRSQDQNSELKSISRTALKTLFKSKRIQLKGQSAVPSSTLAVGITHIDVLGY